MRGFIKSSGDKIRLSHELIVVYCGRWDGVMDLAACRLDVKSITQTTYIEAIPTELQRRLLSRAPCDELNPSLTRAESRTNTDLSRLTFYVQILRIYTSLGNDSCCSLLLTFFPKKRQGVKCGVTTSPPSESCRKPNNYSYHLLRRNDKQSSWRCTKSHQPNQSSKLELSRMIRRFRAWVLSASSPHIA